MTTNLQQQAAELAARWERAWNAHDAESMGKLVTEDADWVTVAGARLRGRTEIVEVHARLHGTLLRNSVWRNDTVEVREIAPGVALSHLQWNVHGDESPDGAPRPPRRGVFTWVLVDHAGDWAIRAAHCTNAA